MEPFKGIKSVVELREEYINTSRKTRCRADAILSHYYQMQYEQIMGYEMPDKEYRLLHALYWIASTAYSYEILDHQITVFNGYKIKDQLKEAGFFFKGSSWVLLLKYL